MFESTNPHRRRCSQSLNANGVAQQSPASRSARWVSVSDHPENPNGVQQIEHATSVEPRWGSGFSHDRQPGVRYATPGFAVERRWRSFADLLAFAVLEARSRRFATNRLRASVGYISGSHS